MGWTTYMATEYKNGKVNRKAECDKLFNFGKETKYSVEKSTMVGKIYYAAVRKQTENADDEVFAVICITCGRVSDGMNFGYKAMDETELPYYYDCPESILKLLTPTESENANEWRKLCREHREAKKHSPSKLPVGTTIEFNAMYDMSSGIKKGDKVTLSKCAGYGRQRDYWSDGYYRWQAKWIPVDYEIVKGGE